MSDIILTVDNFSLNIKNRAVLQNVTFNVERGLSSNWRNSWFWKE